MSNEINLLPKKEIRRLRLTRSGRILQFIALSFIIVIPSATMVLFLLILFSPLPSLQQEEQSLVIQSRQAQDRSQKVAFINDRINKANQFIQNQDNDEKIINQLTQQLPDGVQIDTLTINNKQVNLQATSASLLPLQVYQTAIKTMRSQFFSSVTFQNLDYDTGSNTYGLGMTIKVN